MIPVLTRDAIEPLMDWLALTDSLAEGHRQPPAQIRDVLMARGDDRLLSRSAWIDGLGLGVKSVTITPGNAARGLPSVQGAMLVFDDQTGSIEAMIGEFSREGMTIVMTTHDLGQARRLAEDIVFLDRGRLVESGPAESFFREPASEEARAFLAGNLLW